MAEEGDSDTFAHLEPVDPEPSSFTSFRKECKDSSWLNKQTATNLEKLHGDLQTMMESAKGRLSTLQQSLKYLQAVKNADKEPTSTPKRQRNTTPEMAEYLKQLQKKKTGEEPTPSKRAKLEPVSEEDIDVELVDDDDDDNVTATTGGKTARPDIKKQPSGKKKKKKTAAPDSKKKGKRKKGGDSSDEDSQDDGGGSGAGAPLHNAPATAATFWPSLEPWFQPVMTEDLKLLELTKEDAIDSIFKIPPLGTHFSVKWAEEDGRDHEAESKKNSSSLARTTSRSRGSALQMEEAMANSLQEDLGDLDGENFAVEESLKQHSFSQRLLSALVEENLAPTASIEEEDNEEVNQTPSSHMYNHGNRQMSLEERIRMELQIVGLLGEDEMIDDEKREDDEVCSEIRVLQSQLRDVMNSNNRTRQKLAQAAQMYVGEDKQVKERQSYIQQVEKEYNKMKQRNKKKKRLAVKAKEST